jgi:Transposase DDE domain group 1
LVSAEQSTRAGWHRNSFRQFVPPLQFIHSAVARGFDEGQHSAEAWEEVLLPEVERQQELGKEVVFRADAAFAKPEIYEALEERGVQYAIRLPANDNLQRDIEELLTRPVGRPSHKPTVWYKGFLYQAASWKMARRVVAKVEFHAGELFPRVGFIVTNLEMPSQAVVHFYNKRGTAEQ